MTVRPYEEAQRPAEPKAEAKKAPAKKKRTIRRHVGHYLLVIMPAGKGKGTQEKRYGCHQSKKP